MSGPLTASAGSPAVPGSRLAAPQLLSTARRWCNIAISIREQPNRFGLAGRRQPGLPFMQRRIHQEARLTSQLAARPRPRTRQGQKPVETAPTPRRSLWSRLHCQRVHFSSRVHRASGLLYLSQYCIVLCSTRSYIVHVHGNNAWNPRTLATGALPSGPPLKRQSPSARERVAARLQAASGLQATEHINSNNSNNTEGTRQVDDRKCRSSIRSMLRASVGQGSR